MSPAAKNINQAMKGWTERSAKLADIEKLEQELARGLQPAKQALTDARHQLLLAEAGSMRGLGDRRAEAAKGERAAAQALEDRERRIAAAHLAVQDERRERGLFSAEHRAVFHANTQAVDATMREEAREVAEKVQALQQTVNKAAEVWTPLRPVRRDLGILIGREAHAPVDLQAIVDALELLAERGMNAPSDVNPADGSPIKGESGAAARIRTTTKVDEALAPLMERL